MNSKSYQVYCFKDVDYIATRISDINKIMEFYIKMFEDDLELNDIRRLSKEEKDKEFILINEETQYKEKVTYNKLIEECLILVNDNDADYLYLCSSEW